MLEPSTSSPRGSVIKNNTREFQQLLAHSNSSFSNEEHWSQTIDLVALLPAGRRVRRLRPLSAVVERQVAASSRQLRAVHDAAAPNAPVGRRVAGHLVAAPNTPNARRHSEVVRFADRDQRGRGFASSFMQLLDPFVLVEDHFRRTFERLQKTEEENGDQKAKDGVEEPTSTSTRL